MIRVKFADTVSGVGSYTLPYNPATIEADDNYPLVDKKCYGSESVLFVQPHDSRDVSFIWRGWLMANPVISGMLATMSGWLYQTKYINIGDIYGVYKSIFPVTGWYGPFRIVSVAANIADAPNVYYSDITLKFHKV